MKKYRLIVHSTDEWGNKRYYCPVCIPRKSFKEEGMYTHLDRTKGHIDARTWWLGKKKPKIAIPPSEWPWQHKTVDKSSFSEKLR